MDSVPGLLRAATVTAGAACVLATLAGPAQAETRRFHDPNESGTINDTQGITVRVTKGPRGPGGRVVVKVRAGNVLVTDYFDLWIDVPGSAKNFHARIRPETEYGPVRKVTGFERTGPAACRRWEARAVSSRHTVVLFSIPRRCLGNPGKARVATRSTYVYNQGRERDWVPSARTFTPWVRAS